MSSNNTSTLQTTIETAWENRSELSAAVAPKEIREAVKYWSMDRKPMD